MAAAAIVILMYGLALALATARDRMVDAMTQGATAVKRWGGHILIVVGLWFIALGRLADFFAPVSAA